MVNDVIGGHVTSNFLKKICKIFLFSSKNIRQHFFVKYVKTKHCFGPNRRKNHKIYHRVNSLESLQVQRDFTSHEQLEIFFMCIVYIFQIDLNLNLFWMGGGGGKNYHPLQKMLNNKNFRQAEGLPDLFTEPNLILHVLYKFQVISLIIS